MTTNDNKFYAKNSKKYCCELCDFNTCKKIDYDRHIQTQKHKNNVLTTDFTHNDKKYVCDCCEKKYNDRAGLWRHKKKCSNTNNIVTDIEPSDKNLIMMLIKQNSQLIEKNAELIKNGTHNTTNTNSHNKTKLLKDFKTKYQGCEKSDSQYSDKYDKLIIEAFGGKGDNDEEKENKIIKNIAKNVNIEK